jgi:aspartate/methionine/tyrosine aminotransferase
MKNKIITSYKDATQLETVALRSKFNLADAHTHQSQSGSQLGIVRKLPSLWHEAENTLQYDLEQKFIKAFFRAMRQNTALLSTENVLLTYAASISIAIVSTFLKNKNISTSLLHPCFDNLYDLLKYTQVEVHPLEEEWLYDCDRIYENLKRNIKGNSIFLVEPNNPTGFSLSVHGDRGWNELIRYAKDYNKLLIFDFCFSAFMHGEIGPDLFDRYELLDNAGISYISIEDTGKTWPLQDTKVSMIKMSDNLYEEIYDIHSAYLLNVSPFVLNLVTQYILDSEKDNFSSVISLINRNREIAIKKLSGSILMPLNQEVGVSVLWCKINSLEISSTELTTFLACHKIHILPGTYFFWNKKEIGEEYVRIALARDAEVFINYMDHLVFTLKLFNKPSKQLKYANG